MVTARRRAASPQRTDFGSHLAAIRRFFLTPEETYSLAELAEIWRVQPDDVRDIFQDQLSRSSSPERIAWTDAIAASVCFIMLRPFDIERALGVDFTGVRPETWRTVPVVVHLPKFVLEAVANEPSLPSDLPLAIRVEQVLIDLYARSQSGTGAPAAPERRHPR